MRSGIPLRKSLLVRLMITSVLIALCSVAATAWLAVQTTTRAIQEEQGQALADDTEILRQLSGYAATHADWSGVRSTLRELSGSTGRRVALTAPDRTPIADSAPPAPPCRQAPRPRSTPCTPTPTPSPGRSSAGSTPARWARTG